MNQILLYSSGIIAEEKPTGGELRFLELAEFLADQDDTALCCTDEDDALEPLGLHADLHMSGSDRAPKFLPEEARILLSNRKTLKKIAKQGYAHVIVFDVPPAIGLALCGVRNLDLMIRKDMIGYERVKSPGNGPGKRIRIGYQWICESLCLRHAEKIVFQCAYDRDTLLARHPAQRKKLLPRCEIQINNCNPEWIVKRDRDASREIREDNRFRVCFVGGFDDLRKGQDLFLEAAKNLTEKYPKMEFFLVGGGKRLQTYREQYESDRIRFFGRMDNPLSVIKNCDLVVVPSLADSCPNTVMEALYTGVPVIGSRAGGIPEILTDDNALFDPQWDALAEKIETCYLKNGFLNDLRQTQAERKRELSFNWAGIIVDIIRKPSKRE